MFGMRPIESKWYKTEQELENKRSDPWAHELVDLGEVRQDSEFDNLRQNYTQLRFIEVCDDLEDKDWVKANSVRCWLKDFRQWFKTQPPPDEHDMRLPYQGDSDFLQSQFI
jgi:hypothetical protein